MPVHEHAQARMQVEQEPVDKRLKALPRLSRVHDESVPHQPVSQPRKRAAFCWLTITSSAAAG